MAKDFAKAFYKSKAWRLCRTSFIASKHGLCERCSGVGKIVHHKVLLTAENINNPYVSLNHSKLELLCQECHNKEHMQKYKAVNEGFKFDENGYLVRTDTPPI